MSSECAFERKVLSVVCARAGSKGLKNKCIARIGGKMVVEYAIEYSLSLGEGVKTVVSTDIRELIGYCREKGIACIERDRRITSDESRIDDALADALEREGKGFVYCSLVYGNIPTRYPKLFREALGFLEINPDYDAVMSFQNVEKFHPDWMFDYNADLLGRVKETHYRRQMLSQKMIHDGHTLLFRSAKFLGKYSGEADYGKEYRYGIYGERIKPQINSEVIIDIDTAKDLTIAGAIIDPCGNDKA